MAAVLEETVVREDEPLFEIIDGERVELLPMSVDSVMVASTLHYELQHFAKTHGVGRAVMEALFDLGLARRNRRPDVAYVSFERWPKHQPTPEEGDAWQVVPDLAIEVISPNNLAEEALEKVNEYFQAKVRLVWVVFPRQRVVYVYESWKTIHVLTQEDALDGGAVLPGFRLPLTELFQPAPPNGQITSA